MATESAAAPEAAIPDFPPDKRFQEVLSQRGVEAHFRNHPLTYLGAIFEARKRLWSAADPGGAIVLGVAENRLSSELLTSRIGAARPFPDEAYKYQPPRGSARLKAAVAGYLRHTFMKGIDVAEDDLTVLAGCGSVLDLLFFGVADPGEAVLIPTPYYPAFDADLKARDQVQPQPVNLPASAIWTPALEAASTEAAAAGRCPRAVLLTNPNNPTGEVWPRERLEELLHWCCARGLHLVSDEIYANSVFSANAGFVSMARLVADAGPELQAAAAPLVHVVFGLSKDWCASGLRVGCLHSRNSELAGCLDALGYFASVSNLMQEAASELLEDLDFVDSFIAENCRRLRAAYAAVTEALEAAGIPYVPAVAAMFVWVDMRHFLPAPTWKAERELWQALVSQCGVILTPGKDCHAAEPGFFRICYAAVERDAVLTGLARIRQHLAGVGKALQNGTT